MPCSVSTISGSFASISNVFSVRDDCSGSGWFSLKILIVEALRRNGLDRRLRLHWDRASLLCRGLPILMS